MPWSMCGQRQRRILVMRIHALCLVYCRSCDRRCCHMFHMYVAARYLHTRPSDIFRSLIEYLLWIHLYCDSPWERFHKVFEPGVCQSAMSRWTDCISNSSNPWSRYQLFWGLCKHAEARTILYQHALWACGIVSRCAWTSCWISCLIPWLSSLDGPCYGCNEPWRPSPRMIHLNNMRVRPRTARRWTTSWNKLIASPMKALQMQTMTHHWVPRWLHAANHDDEQRLWGKLDSSFTTSQL